MKSGLPFLLVRVVIVTLAIMNIPATASSDNLFKRSVAYHAEGFISMNSEIGTQFTPSVREQSIRGDGEVKKSEKVLITPYIMRVEDDIRWFTHENALRNITVMTNIQLAARPLSSAAFTYDAGSHIIEEGDIINPYLPIVVDGNIILEPMSAQVWYTRISSDPGHYGAFKAEYVAAYGPGPYQSNLPDYDTEYSWWLNGLFNVDYGQYYVGNYFEIDQYIYTSQGDTRRLINMSSPFSYNYYWEELRVIGRLTVWEDFKLLNIPRGRHSITMYWSDFELFF